LKNFKKFISKKKKYFREYKKHDNETDLGMKPGNGLESPHIAVVDVEKNVNKARSKSAFIFITELSKSDNICKTD